MKNPIQRVVHDDKDGVAQRALVVIDRDGVIQWSYLSPKGMNPGAAGLLKPLEALPSNNIQRTLPSGHAQEQR